MANYPGSVKDTLNFIRTNVLPHDTSVASVPANRFGISNMEDYITYTLNLPTQTEKSSTTSCYGFAMKDLEDLYWPHYVKLYNVPTVGEVLDRILVSSILEAQTTPLETYGVCLNATSSSPIISSSAIDLGKLVTKDENTPVKTIRLDRLLKKAGFPGEHPDLNSFYDVQRFVENEYVNKVLSPRAIIQVVLSSYFLPNPLGETDPNSRNIILADVGYGQFDIAIRIDAESNTYLRSRYNERSGKRQVPKGIYMPNEPSDVFLENIKNKSIMNGPKIDWELFRGFLDLSEAFLAEKHLMRSIVDNGYSRTQMRHIGSIYDQFRTNPYTETLSMDSYMDFAKASYTRADTYLKDVRNALGYVSSKNLFEGKDFSREIPQLDTAFIDRTGVIYDHKGNIIKPEDFQPSL